jgi:hypothetical protein
MFPVLILLAVAGCAFLYALLPILDKRGEKEE